MLDFQSVISTSVVFHSEHDLEKKKNEQKTEKKKKIIGERKTVTQKEIFMEGKVKWKKEKKNDSRRCGIFRGQSRPDYNRNCKQSATRCLAEQYKYKTNTNT